MNRVKRLGTALFLCTVLCNMEFTTPKKKRGGPTSAQLASDIGGLLKDGMCQLFDITDEVTTCQRAQVELMEVLMEQPKDSFFARASREELQACKTELERHADELAVVHKKIRAYTHQLHAKLQTQKRG